jgi:hypothetical protein
MGQGDNLSIVANYARLSAAQLSQWIDAPSQEPEEFVRQLSDAESMDIDQAWGPMAWLISGTKRLEDEHNWRVMHDPSFVDPKPGLMGRLLGKKIGLPKAVVDSLAKLDAAEIDPPLVAIEGRAERHEERLDFGMGGAAIFHPDQVEALSRSLNSISPNQLRTNLDPERMDELGVFPGHWVEEGQELMEEYILPNLARLKTFYQSAASLRQCVVMWYR